MFINTEKKMKQKIEKQNEYICIEKNQKIYLYIFIYIYLYIY